MRPTEEWVNGSPVVDLTNIDLTNRVHGSIAPVDVTRYHTSYGEFRAEAMPHHRLRVPIVRASILGMEVVAPLDHHISAGRVMPFDWLLDGQLLALSAEVVDSSPVDSEREWIGARWANTETATATPGWRVPSGSGVEAASGWAREPGRLNGIFTFRVTEMASDHLCFRVNGGPQLLLPGLLIRATICLPGVGTYQIPLRIMRAIDEGVCYDGTTTVRARILATSSDLSSAMGQYLLSVDPLTTVERLREGGLAVRSVTAAVKFSCLTAADEDFDRVLVLRHNAYRDAGKLDARGQATAGDRFDEDAIFPVARHGDRVVASMRLSFPAADEHLEHEQHVTLPASFPPRESMVEITRVCTDRTFRKSDLLLGLFQFSLLQIVDCGRPYVIGSATQKLLPLYVKLGFRPTGLRFHPEEIGGEEHEVFLGDVSAAMKSGRGIGALSWAAVVWPVWNFLRCNPAAVRRHRPAPRLSFYLFCRPLAERLLAVHPAGRRTRSR